MKSEYPSDMRQWLNVIGAQIETPNPDPMLVFKTCQLIAMEAADKSKPLPADVFAEGINDELARMALSSMCLSLVQMAGGRLRKPPAS